MDCFCVVPNICHNSNGNTSMALEEIHPKHIYREKNDKDIPHRGYTSYNPAFSSIYFLHNKLPIMIQIPRDEKIILVLRKHWFVLLAESLVFIILAVAPAFILGLGAYFLQPNLGSPITLLAIGGYIFWLMALWVGFFVFWTDFYLDIWIITDKRIIDIEQKGLFSRTTSALRHENIQDSSISQGGLIATMFGFGNVKVQSAATDVQIDIPFAKSPQKVKELIMRLHDKTIEENKTVRLHKEDLHALKENLDKNTN